MTHWEGITEFVTVVELHSFTAAAQHLGLSVAQVSRQIAALERRLSTRLLYRTTRRVSVTEPGQQYYRHCKASLDGLLEAERALSQTLDKPAGHLRITAPVFYGETVIAPILHRYLRDFPAVTAELNLDNRKLDLVAEAYDLGIRLGPSEDASQTGRQLASRTHHVCASPAYLQQHGEPQTLTDLKHHQCIVGRRGTWRFQENEGRIREFPVQGRLRCNSGIAVVDAALQGLGLIQLPDYYVAEHIRQGRLRSVLTAWQLQDGVWANSPRSLFPPPKLSHLLTYLETALIPTSQP